MSGEPNTPPDLTPADISAAALRIVAHCCRAVNGRRELTPFEDDAYAVATATDWPTDDAEPVTADWLYSAGWRAVGNTWYTSAVHFDDIPVVMWIGVDQSVRVAGLNNWKLTSPTRRQFRRLCEVFGVTLTERVK